MRDAAGTPAATTPPAAAASATLSGLAQTAGARRRIGYVNLERLGAFGGDLSADEIESLVLGSGAARLDGHDGATRATQLGSTTILDGESRIIIGAPASERAELESTTPQISAITDETPSAVQSCLGDATAETVLGPATLGYRASIGASILDSQDAPRGRKLLICAAPHFYRELATIQKRMKALFPAGNLPEDVRPVIGDEDIGERDIARATVPLDRLDPALVRDLLSGGPALVDLARG